jgi:hypothetical protein
VRHTSRRVILSFARNFDNLSRLRAAVVVGGGGGGGGGSGGGVCVCVLFVCCSS